MEEEIISKPKIKRTRKPKQVKEEYNNIDTIKIENINDYDEKIVREENPVPEENVIPAEQTIPVKKPRGRKPKEIIPPKIGENFISIAETLLNPTENIPQIPENITPIKYDIIKYEYTTPITHIYHLSDIHIQLYKRHHEYQEIFNKVYTYLKSEKAKFKIPEIPFL